MSLEIPRPPCIACGGQPCRTPCAQCGYHVEGGLCSTHHESGPWDKWSDENRAWCGYFHRGVPLPRLPAAQREEPYGALNDPSWA